MGGKRVAQRMWRDTTLNGRATYPSVETTPHIGGRQASAGLRNEQRGLRILFERRSPALEVARDRAPRRFTCGDHTRLRALAEHAQVLGVRIGVGDVEVPDPLGAPPLRVRELEHRAIA